MKIYEGDIIKIPPDYEKYFAYSGFRLKPKYNLKSKGCWLEDNDELEVIGNIYDNPELLKGE